MVKSSDKNKLKILTGNGIVAQNIEKHWFRAVTVVLCGRGHLLLGRQNLCQSTIILILGSPHCVLFCFVGHPLSNVENHWFRAMRFPIIFASFFSVIFGYCRLFSGIDFVQYFRQFRLFSSFVSRRITEKVNRGFY